MIYIKLLSLLLCLLFINCQKQGKPFEESKIVGGKPSRVWTFPYMASIETNTSHLGSATILSQLWLAAPAHIFAYEYWYFGLENIKKTMHLRIGTSFILRGGYVYHIQNMTFYPTFVNTSLINDLVLIMTSVAMAIPQRYMKSITIHDFKWVPKQGDVLKISGWGATKTKGGVSKQLRSAEVRIVTNEICIDAYRRIPENRSFELYDHQFCATATSAALCFRDDGAPAVFKGRLAGMFIKSYNNYNRCGLSFFPSIFLKMSHFITWITSQAHLTS